MCYYAKDLRPPLSLSLELELIAALPVPLTRYDAILAVWCASNPVSPRTKKNKHCTQSLIIGLLPLSQPPNLFQIGVVYGIRTRYFLCKPLSGLSYFFGNAATQLCYLLFSEAVLSQIYN